MHVGATADALSLAAAEQFVRIVSGVVEQHGTCSVALTGGSTPRGMYGVLADAPALRSEVPWSRIEFFWGDERHVPPDHPESNYRMAYETMLSKVPVAPGHIHRIRAEGDAADAAREYEADIVATLPAPPGRGSPPRFDLVLLGLGPDGHIASLFPGTAALAETRRLCVDNWVPSLGAFRITMTLPLLNAAKAVLFLVSGAQKAPVVRQVLRPDDPASTLPAQLVQPSGDLLWMLDRDAASQLH